MRKKLEDKSTPVILIRHSNRTKYEISEEMTKLWFNIIYY